MEVETKTEAEAEAEVKVEVEQRRRELAALLEAALFITARPLTIHELKKISTKAGIFSLTEIKNAIETLQRKYTEEGSWIEIAEVDGRFLMRIAPQYVDSVAELAQAAELSKPALRVLAIVAKNDGVTQARCVRTIGNSTYEGVKELVEKGFLHAKRAGRTKELWLTKKFKLYFGEIK